MRIVLLASGGFAIPTLRSLLNRSDVEIACVVTQPDRPGGRGRALIPTEVRKFAEQNALTVHAIADVNQTEFVSRLASVGAQLGVVIAFGQKLGPALLAVFPSGCVNLHASLLPKYRGAAPIQWAIINGEEKTGVTVFRITDRMDAGPVLTARWTFIKPVETAAELHDRLAHIGPDAVTASLDLFQKDANPPGTTQDETAVSKAPTN